MNQIFLTVDELAESLKVHKSWVYARTRKNGPATLPVVRIGKYLRFRFEDVLAWVEGQQDIAGEIE